MQTAFFFFPEGIYWKTSVAIVYIEAARGSDNSWGKQEADQKS